MQRLERLTKVVNHLVRLLCQEFCIANASLSFGSRALPSLSHVSVHEGQPVGLRLISQSAYFLRVMDDVLDMIGYSPTAGSLRKTLARWMSPCTTESHPDAVPGGISIASVWG